MTTSTERNILRHIEKNREETVDFLQQLVRIPSVTGDEKEIQEFISKRLNQMGLSVDMWEPNVVELKKHPAYVPVSNDYTNRPNVVGIIKGRGRGRSLLLNGHVDVVPVGSLHAWTKNPWKAEVEKERVFGRGSSDMKSGLAAMTMALEAIIKSGTDLKGDVILEYTVDEELSGNGTLACILRGYKADAGISCETSGLRVQPASIGRIWFEISVKGKPAGIQRGWEGVNSIVEGYKIVQAVSELEKTRISKLSHPLYPDTREALPCMVCVFQAGSYPSAFPDHCLLKGSLATLPGEDSGKVKRAFVKHIHKAALRSAWLGQHLPEVKFEGYFAEPSEIPTKHPIVKMVSKKFEEVAKKRPLVSGRNGAADTRFLNKYGATPSVIFGPGLTEQMHAVDEYVEIDDLITATKVIGATIVNWCR